MSACCRLWALVDLLIAVGCSRDKADGRTVIFAASSLREAFTALGTDFERTHPGVRPSGNRRWTPGQRLIDKLETMMRIAPTGEKQPVATHTAAFCGDISDLSLRYLYPEAVEQCAQIHVPDTGQVHGRLAASVVGRGASGGGMPSGGTAKMRSAPAAIVENTGAATSPP